MVVQVFVLFMVVSLFSFANVLHQRLASQCCVQRGVKKPTHLNSTQLD